MVSACDPPSTADFDDRDGAGHPYREVKGLPFGARSDLHTRALLAARNHRAKILEWIKQNPE